MSPGSFAELGSGTGMAQILRMKRIHEAADEASRLALSKLRSTSAKQTDLIERRRHLQGVVRDTLKKIKAQGAAAPMSRRALRPSGAAS